MRPTEHVGRLPECEHHWVTKHQPDFPEPIYWVATCSQCGQINGSQLAEEVEPLRAEVERLAEELADLRENTFPKSWDGFRAFIDEHYPADVFVNDATDLGPQLVGASRVIADLRVEVERLTADAERQRRRVEDFEGRYETAHASRMWAEECFRHAERQADQARRRAAQAKAERDSLRDAVAKVQEACEQKFFNVKRGLHDDEGTWPVVRVEDLVAALGGAAPEGDSPAADYDKLRAALLTLSDTLEPEEGPVILAWSVDRLAERLAELLGAMPPVAAVVQATPEPDEAK